MQYVPPSHASLHKGHWCNEEACDGTTAATTATTSARNLLSLDVVTYAYCRATPVRCHLQPVLYHVQPESQVGAVVRDAQGAGPMHAGDLIAHVGADVRGAQDCVAGPVHAISDRAHAPLSST